MSGRKLPDYKSKQKILYIDNTEPETLVNYGDLFLAEGKVSDALEFYKKANYYDGLEKIKAIALETADVMLYAQAMKALNKEPSALEWEQIGEKAIALKKYFFAKHALEKAGKPHQFPFLKQTTEAGNSVKND